MIEPKKKKCHGTTAETKGWGCGQMVYERVFGLGKMCCYPNWLLNSEPGRIKMEKARLKVRKEKQKEENRILKQKKENLTDYKKKLQEKINKIVRLIDIGLPCLAKQKHANQMHAGHVFSRGSNPTIRYNLHNIHRQSAQSNHYQNDDGLLREGIVREYGKDYMDFISELRQINRLEFNNDEFKTLYNRASKIALEMQREGKIYPTVEERIEKRNELNLRLGIYEPKYCVYGLER